MNHKAKCHRDEKCPIECIGSNYMREECFECKGIFDGDVKAKQKENCPKECPYYWCSEECKGKKTLWRQLSEFAKRQA